MNLFWKKYSIGPPRIRLLFNLKSSFQRNLKYNSTVFWWETCFVEIIRMFLSFQIHYLLVLAFFVNFFLWSKEGEIFGSKGSNHKHMGIHLHQRRNWGGTSISAIRLMVKNYSMTARNGREIKKPATERARNVIMDSENHCYILGWPKISFGLLILNLLNKQNKFWSTQSI